MVDLHASDPKQVSSNGMIDIFIGRPTHHLLVYTGIAIPQWDSQSSVDNEQVTVYLGRPVAKDGSPITVVGLFGHTATVGLASIRSDEEDFIFATEDVDVSLVDGEPVLVSNIVVQGEPAVLNRFSYEANVIVDVDEPIIAGTIFWTDETAQVASMNRKNNLFTITAYTELAPPPDGVFGTTQVVAVGEVTGALIEQAPNFFTRPPLPGRFLVPYAIRNVPLDIPVHVKVELQSGAFSPSFPNTLSLKQISGPDPITLTLAHMKEPNVNFEMNVNQMPH